MFTDINRGPPANAQGCRLAILAFLRRLHLIVKWLDVLLLLALVQQIHSLTAIINSCGGVEPKEQSEEEALMA